MYHAADVHLNQSENIWKTIFLELEIDPHLTLLNYIFDQAFDIMLSETAQCSKLLYIIF